MTEKKEKSTPKRKKRPYPLNEFILESKRCRQPGGAFFQYEIDFINFNTYVRIKKNRRLCRK